MKKIEILCIFFFLSCLALCFSSCGNKVEDTAKEEIQLFNSHDSDKINELIFGKPLEVDSEFQDYFTNENKSEYSVLNEIVNKATIKYLGKDEDTVKLEIIAPNMEGVFEDSAVLSTNEEKALYNAIKDYAEKANLKTFTIDIGYTDENGETVINYRNPQFINAITGGLQNEYHKLYESMLNSYMEELK